MKDTRLYLIHINECIARIEKYTSEGRDSFFTDEKTQDAVLRNLQTLAESTQLVDDSIKAAHPEVEWQSISAFRNILVHDYLGIDLNQIWDIVERDLPRLKRAMEMILKESEEYGR